jgi:hypothetical protein
MITWDPSTSVIVAPARSAIERITSVPAALSPVATTAQEGRSFQAGAPPGSENPDSVEIGAIKHPLTPRKVRPNTESAPGVQGRIARGAAALRQERRLLGSR